MTRGRRVARRSFPVRLGRHRLSSRRMAACRSTILSPTKKELAPSCCITHVGSNGENTLHSRKYLQALVRTMDGSATHVRNCRAAWSAARESAIAAVALNGSMLEYLPHFNDDVRVVLAAVCNDGTSLRHAGPNARSDKATVLMAVNNDGLAVQFASEELRRDEDIVRAAVFNDGDSLQFAHESLRDNASIVVQAIVESLGWAFQLAGPTLHDCTHTATLAVTYEGYMLEFASARVRSLRDVVLRAVSQPYRGDVVRYASVDIRNDKEVALAALRHPSWENGQHIVQFLGEDVQQDRQVALTAVTYHGESFEYLHTRHRSDKQICLTAVRQFSRMFEHASIELRGDADVIVACTRSWMYETGILELATTRIKFDKALVTRLVSCDGLELQFAAMRLRADRDVAFAAVRSRGMALQYVSNDLKLDPDLVLEAVRNDGRALKYADESLRKNERVVMQAVQSDASALEYAAALAADTRVVMQLVVSPRLATIPAFTSFQHASALLRRDRQLVLKIVSWNGLALQYAHHSLHGDREVVLAAVRNNGHALNYATSALQRDEVVVTAALCSCGAVLGASSVGDKFRSDKNAVLAAVSNCGDAIVYACDLLRGDEDVIMCALASGARLTSLCDATQRSRRIVLAAVHMDGLQLRHAQKIFQADRDVVLTAVQENGHALIYAHGSLRHDMEVVSAAASSRRRIIMVSDAYFRNAALRRPGKRQVELLLRHTPIVLPHEVVQTFVLPFFSRIDEASHLCFPPTLDEQRVCTTPSLI